MLVDVVLDLPLSSKETYFTYQVPSFMQGAIQMGCRVQVPFGPQNRSRLAYVIAVRLEDDERCKHVKRLIDRSPILSSDLIELGQWLSRHYLCTVWQALEQMLPTYARQKKKWRVQLMMRDDEPEDVLLAAYLKALREDDDPEKWSADFPDWEKSVFELEKQGFLLVEESFQQRGEQKKKIVYRALLSSLDALSEGSKRHRLDRAPQQKQMLLQLMADGPQEARALRGHFKNTYGLLKALIDKGLVAREEEEDMRSPLIAHIFSDQTAHTLTPLQKEALASLEAAIDARWHKAFLLHGVTGSGKTEIYLQAIRAVRKQGKSALLLVPEIALTPQLVGRFRAKFEEDVAVLHSHMSDGERLDEWLAIQNGKKNIVIGVRSAVFAPLKNPGIFIIDEEHERTYKQGEPAPRYDARQVALERAKKADAVYLAGSATPAVETYHAATSGAWHLLELPVRINQKPLPEVTVVDMRTELKAGNYTVFSRHLFERMKNVLAKQQQIILYLNKRGFSSFVMCRECGHTIECDRCEVAMTMHQKEQVLRCHYCNAVKERPETCPACGSRAIRFFGSGTELVENAIQEYFPGIRSLRMDSDSTRRKNAHQEILASFRKGDADVLIGTQMVAKGLDVENVALVGVISADVGLHLADFRSSERAFQQLTQVAGRAGRGDVPGEVVIQTYTPDHPAIIAASMHDYHMFYNREIAVRKQMSYPPFSYLLRVLISDFNQASAQSVAEELADVLRQTYPDATVLGPGPAPIERIRNRYRSQFFIKDRQRETLVAAGLLCKQHRFSSRISKTLRIIVDIDPDNIL